jgi:hypothetical protein
MSKIFSLCSLAIYDRGIGQNIALRRYFDSVNGRLIARSFNHMTNRSQAGSTRLYIAYYSATAIFLLLDYVAGINIRVAFLDDVPGWRLLYYLFCFGCLGLIAWQRRLSTLVATIESLITLVALIITTALRVLVVNDQMLQQGRDFVSLNEIVNFLIAGGIAYYSYSRGMRSLRRGIGASE